MGVRSGWGVRVDVDKEQRIEVFVKIYKKKVRGSGWGVRVDVNEKFL